jgi:hypothetical protein
VEWSKAGDTLLNSQLTVERLGSGIVGDRQDYPLAGVAGIDRLPAVAFPTAADVEDKVFGLSFPSPLYVLSCQRCAGSEHGHENDHADST